MNKTEFDALVVSLSAAASAYYDGTDLAMTDAEYDAGIEQVQATLAERPDWASAATGGLLGSVAAGQSSGGDVIHPTRMLSMGKVASGEQGLGDVASFVAKIGGPVVVEPKMDGLALRVTFENGVMVLAATRGDGSTGEDVTAQAARAITGLPSRLRLPWTGEVRGEVYMSTSDFERANAGRLAAGERPFVNPRNGVAGSLRKKDRDYDAPMHFAAYDLLDSADSHHGHDSHHDRMLFAKSLGFDTALDLLRQAGAGAGVCLTAEVAVAAIGEIETIRPTLDFEIDGAVVKADRDADRSALGEGSRTPNWAIAYKYAPQEASAVIEDIEVSVGRTGRIGLRARITPTFVGGTTVTYATLHNPAFVAEQGLGIGSKVVLKRAGDVIPRITAPLDIAENAHISPWTPPETCPQCNEPWDKSSLLWRCTTPSCGLANAIEYAFSRDCLDVEGIGGAVAEALAETTFAGGRRINDIADVYALNSGDWASLIMGTTSTGGTRYLGETTARKIMLGLLDSKKQPFNRVITALGIRMTGRSVGRWLAAFFPTMDRLRAATVEQVAQIDKMGPIKAQHVVDGLAAMAPVIDRLAAAGLNMGTEPSAEADALPLAGKTFVISGSIPGRSRTEAQEAIEAAGGKASSSVSAKTAALITDETTTSKAVKAASLGVQIIDPAKFEALLRGEVL